MNFSIKPLLVLALIGLTLHCEANNNDNLITLEKLSANFQEAIKSRNYKAAKSSLHDLLPVMKVEIKSSKRQLKSIEDDQKESAQKNIKRKESIHNRLNHLLGVSPAALRVKADMIHQLVLEFEELVTSE